jgi:hypothetical protein
MVRDSGKKLDPFIVQTGTHFSIGMFPHENPSPQRMGPHFPAIMFWRRT